jgi:hypothetical protein
MKRLLRATVVVAVAPFGLLAVAACTSALALGVFCALLCDCFGIGRRFKK